MCYFLYGAINDEINKDDFNKAASNSKFYFSTGTKEEVNECIKACNGKFRITRKMCDCDTAIGSHKTGKFELKEFVQFLTALRSVRNIKHIYLSKNWFKETNTKEVKVHIDDIDMIDYFANIENNCLYQLQLYKRYYDGFNPYEQTEKST